jgi:hypothetical protein
MRTCSLSAVKGRQVHGLTARRAPVGRTAGHGLYRQQQTSLKQQRQQCATLIVAEQRQPDHDETEEQQSVAGSLSSLLGNLQQGHLVPFGLAAAASLPFCLDGGNGSGSGSSSSGGGGGDGSANPHELFVVADASEGELSYMGCIICDIKPSRMKPAEAGCS